MRRSRSTTSGARQALRRETTTSSTGPTSTRRPTRVCRQTRVQQSSTYAGSAGSSVFTVGFCSVDAHPGSQPLPATASQARSASTARRPGSAADRARSNASRAIECPILALQAGDDQGITADDNATFERALTGCGRRARDRRLRRGTAQLLRPEAGGVRGRVRGRVAPRARVRRLARLDPRDRPGDDRHDVPRRRRGAAGASVAATASCRSTSRGPAGSSTTPKRSGRASRPLRRPLADAGVRAAELAAVGIANQRETTLLWERRAGEPVQRAIVWQDRRTAERCRELARRADPRADGARAGSVLLGDEARVAARATRRAGRRARVRHRRLVAGLEADRRRGARDRRDERVAHDACSISRRSTGTTSCSSSSASTASLLPRDRALARRRRRRRVARRALPVARHRRRSAGGALRARVLHGPARRRRRTGRAASCS